MKDLYRYVDTDFVLVTQWDGYAITAECLVGGIS
jgi:hypothetical protein